MQRQGEAGYDGLSCGGLEALIGTRALGGVGRGKRWTPGENMKTALSRLQVPAQPVSEACTR